jgi:hypothetical protein
MQLTRQKLGKKTHPDHGGRRRPTATMVPFSWRRGIQQSANMLRDNYMSLKIENIFDITIYYLFKGTAHRQHAVPGVVL